MGIKEKWGSERQINMPPKAHRARKQRGLDCSLIRPTPKPTLCR